MEGGATQLPVDSPQGGTPRSPSYRVLIVDYAARGPFVNGVTALPLLLRPTLTRSERKAAHALAEAAGLNHASSAVISGDGGSGSSGKAPRQLKIWWKDSATGPVVLDAFADVPRQLPARDTAAAVTADAAAAAARAPELSTRGGAHWVVWAARVAAVWISGYNICSRRGRLDHAVLASAALGTLCHSTFVRPRPRAFDEVNSPLRLLRKAETVLNARSSQLLVVIERSTDSHNYSAVLRTAEALGVQHVWTVQAPPEVRTHSNSQRKPSATSSSWARVEEERRQHVAFARGAARWLTLRDFPTSEAAIAAMRADGREIWVTELGQSSEILTRDEVMPRRLAVVFGSESSGISSAMAAAADRSVYLPLHGMADSLNLSVSAALIMHSLLGANEATTRGTLSRDEKIALRARFYEQLARSDAERVAFAELVSTPPPPFDDVRRPDAHRVPWVSKRQKARDAAANRTLAATMGGSGGSEGSGGP